MDIILAPKPKKVWRNSAQLRQEKDSIKLNNSPSEIALDKSKSKNPTKEKSITKKIKNTTSREDKDELVNLEFDLCLEYSYSFDNDFDLLEDELNDKCKIKKNTFETEIKKDFEDFNEKFVDDLAVNELFDIMTDSTYDSSNFKRLSSCDNFEFPQNRSIFNRNNHINKQSDKRNSITINKKSKIAFNMNQEEIKGFYKSC